MTVSLRPYQATAIEEIRQAVRAKHRRQVLQLVTGGGKSITAASIAISALQKGKRILVVAHRTELIDQMVSTFERLGITSVGVIRATDKRLDPSQPIQVASIQTLARRAKPPADLVIVDECHHAAADTWTKNIFDAYPDAMILGLSATPARTDGKPLGAHFTWMVRGPTYAQLFETGHLAEPLVYGTPITPDLKSVRTTAGEFNQADLEAAVNQGALVGNILAEWQRRAEGRRTIVFAVSVAHSRAIVGMFLAAGISAAHLDGETDEDERRDIIARLGDGRLDLVSNCAVLTEGTDIPSVKCIVLARPTKSLSLFIQMSGRALRPWENVAPLILDHGGNVDRHGLPHEDRQWSLDAKPKRTSEAPAAKACPTCFAFVPGGVRVCPHCEHDFPVPAPKEPPPPVVVDLELRTLAGNTDDVRMRMFRQYASDCRRKGWHFGAAVHQFERSFKDPPPREWIEALKKDFRRDQDWKARVKQRAEERAEREQAA